MTAAPATAKALNHEEIFLERYDQLLKWALQLAKPDRELARDLVQESFLQFSLSVTELIGINNIDNYLHGIVRNTYLSHLRKSPHRYHLHFDFDELKTLSLTVDPRSQIYARDELLAICQRACVRKETSLAASLLILRFFHGYMPGEIARLTHRSRNVVDVQLKLARWEIIDGAESKGSHARVIENGPTRNRVRDRLIKRADFLTELRNEIFATKRGDCFDADQFKRIKDSNKPIGRNKLSHLVSCVRCLDEVNRMFGWATLKERNVFDLLGRAKETIRSTKLYSFTSKSSFLLTGWTFWALITLSDYLA